MSAGEKVTGEPSHPRWCRELVWRWLDTPPPSLSCPSSNWAREKRPPINAVESVGENTSMAQGGKRHAFRK